MCGCSLMVEHQSSKLIVGVQFPLPTPLIKGDYMKRLLCFSIFFNIIFIIIIIIMIININTLKNDLNIKSKNYTECMVKNIEYKWYYEQMNIINP